MIEPTTWKEWVLSKGLIETIVPAEFEDYPSPFAERNEKEEKEWWKNEVLKQKFIILSIKANQQFIGFVKGFDLSADGKQCECGIEIFSPSNYGKGIGFQAMKLFLNYLQHQMKMDTTIALIHPQNNRSIHLFRKLGFNDLGLVKEPHPPHYSFLKMSYNFSSC